MALGKLIGYTCTIGGVIGGMTGFAIGVNDGYNHSRDTSKKFDPAMTCMCSASFGVTYGLLGAWSGVLWPITAFCVIKNYSDPRK